MTNSYLSRQRTQPALLIISAASAIVVMGAFLLGAPPRVAALIASLAGANLAMGAAFARFLHVSRPKPAPVHTGRAISNDTVMLQLGEWVTAQNVVSRLTRAAAQPALAETARVLFMRPTSASAARLARRSAA